jgi:hypothetical protein
MEFYRRAVRVKGVSSVGHGGLKNKASAGRPPKPLPAAMTSAFDMITMPRENTLGAKIKTHGKIY